MSAWTVNRKNLRVKLLSLGLALAGCFGPSLTVSAEEEAAISPKEKIVLFNGKDLTNFYTYLGDTKYEDPKRVISVVEQIDGAPAIRISGEGEFGGLTTSKRYTNYKLVAEYRWGDLTWGKRKNAARDSGILLHGFGPDGAYSKVWLASIECQIIEGGVGDFLAVPGVDKDGKPLTPSLTAESKKDRDGESCWHAGGDKKTITSGRINWFDRDEDWKDTLGFRGKADVESPFREWTKVECDCEDDQITIRVNGIVVNKATKVSPTAGKLMFQTEGAEIYFRKIELHPLK